MTRGALLLLAACGGGGGDGTTELTCDLLAQPTNCWATAAQALAACLPARATPAMLAADRASCTFTDGARVVFDAPLPMATTDLHRLAFTVEASGATCAAFTDTFMNRMELTGGGATVVSTLLAGQRFELQCDGGPTYETAFSTLFTCQPPAVAPTDGFEVTSTGVTFTLVSVATPGPLFTCGS